MSDPKDKETKPDCPESPEDESGQAPKSYYYDDSTGYEIYDPEREDDEATNSQESS